MWTLLQWLLWMIPVDENDLYSNSDDPASISDWSMVAPTPKALPLPPVLQSTPRPRIPAPFQVSTSGSSNVHHAEARISRAPVKHSPGLALPPSRETAIDSLRYPDRKIESFQWFASSSFFPTIAQQSSIQRFGCGK